MRSVSPDNDPTAELRSAARTRASGLRGRRRPELNRFQLRVLFYQLLQPEARELYRNLGFFSLTFALIDQSFAILRVAHFLSRTEPSVPSGLLNWQFGNFEFPAPRGEELGDVIN